MGCTSARVVPASNIEGKGRVICGLYELDDYGQLVKVTSTDEEARQQAFKHSQSDADCVRVWDETLSNFENVSPKMIASLSLWGVPASIRGRVWTRVSGAGLLRERNPDYFSACDNCSSASIDQILRDVTRTYPEHSLFRTKHGQAQLLRVLNAFAVADPQVGYVQGMNFLAALFLMHADSVEDAFWLLMAYMRVYNMRQFYVGNLAQLNADLKLCCTLLHSEFPAVSDRLQSDNMDFSVFIPPWFLTLFAYNLPVQQVAKVIDCLFAIRGMKLPQKLSKFKIKRVNQGEWCGPVRRPHNEQPHTPFSREKTVDFSARINRLQRFLDTHFSKPEGKLPDLELLPAADCTENGRLFVIRFGFAYIQNCVVGDLSTLTGPDLSVRLRQMDLPAQLLRRTLKRALKMRLVLK